MKIKITLFAAFSLILLTKTAFSQQNFQPAAVPKKVMAKTITAKITVDGRLDEQDWKTCDTVAGFTQIEPNQGLPAAFKTVVKILYSETNLYIGATCYDSMGKKGIRVTELKRDFTISVNDVFAFAIDAFNDKRNNMTYATNPYASQFDYLSFDAQLKDADWNGLWKVRTSITDSGWTAEFEIPWKTLRYKQSDSTQSWGINFYRSRRLSNEISVWSPYPRSFGFDRMEFAGLLTNIQPPKPSANIQLNPYVLASYNKINKSGSATDKMKQKIGGDIKWAINSNTVLDATINTDFAQADADIAVNNITRFSILFPERRQFFLENASLFGPGLNGTTGSMYIYPFFSRTIGLDNGNPIPIEAGARFVSRSPKKNFGAMVIRQAGTENSPLTHFAVARYSQNLSKQNRIGALISMKSVAASALFSSYNNINSSLDGFFRFDKTNSLSVMAIHSSNTKAKGLGFAGYAQYLYTTNAIQAYWTESVITKNYENEMGFVSRQDIIGTTPGFVTNFRGKWVPFKKWIRALQPDAFAEFYHQASTGKLIESTVAIYPFWVLLHSGGFFGYSITPNYQYLTENFSPLGMAIEKGVYRFTRSSFYLNSDPSRVLSYSLFYDIGKYFDGRLVTFIPSLAYSPIPHISLKFSLSKNDFKSIGIKDTSANVSLYTFEGRLALNPRLQLNNLLQYNTQNKTTAFNIRLSWEYKPLSYLFFVFNNRNRNMIERQVEQDGIIKLSYLKQF
ncbi:MAG TPA: DUF5916 domain-containing protein [Chitinophagaceae bacterium]|nr:DUF5916 domain-containing protein [Chitinophagaceae bacterium]